MSMPQEIFHAVRRHVELMEKEKEYSMGIGQSTESAVQRQLLHSYRKQEPEKKLKYIQDLLNIMVRFMQEKYWRRLWIIQEICLAPSLRLLYGSYCVSWRTFSSALDDIFPKSSTYCDNLHYKRLKGFRQIMRSNLVPVNLMNTHLITFLIFLK